MHGPAEEASRLEPGSAHELARFQELQGRLVPLFERVFPDPREPRTVVVIPSLGLDPDVLAHIVAVEHYEERLLCMLMLLRLPRTRVIYVTGTPIDPAIVSYYLHMLPGIPGSHARKRLTMLSCHDASPRTGVTEKILARPRLLERIRDAIGDPSTAHMTCFNATAEERTLAVRLGIPLFGCDPALADLGNKSGSRRIFGEAGVPHPDGFEDLRGETDIADALIELKRRHPELKRAAVKLNEGTSGEGNAVFSFDECPRDPAGLERWIRGELAARLRFDDPGQDWESYIAKFEEMQGIVECWAEGDDLRSPSVQCRITPLGEIEVISTHDQVLGGSTNQQFLGCSFPAAEEYRLEIQDVGVRVSEVLREKGVLGRFGVDFVSIRTQGRWEHHAIEINLRKGGTTHTFRMLQFLTDGHFDPATGLFFTPAGESRFYYASDNLKNAHYKRLTPDDLMDVVVENGLHFHGSTQKGVFFHLIGALSGYGKLGLVCVGESEQEARDLYQQTVEVLDREALADRPPPCVDASDSDRSLTSP
ncbi:MAG: carboxylate-amine ligase [bacterium]|nr:carboxylate-amine ligase [bacterium]